MNMFQLARLVRNSSTPYWLDQYTKNEYPPGTVERWRKQLDEMIAEDMRLYPYKLRGSGGDGNIQLQPEGERKYEEESKETKEGEKMSIKWEEDEEAMVPAINQMVRGTYVGVDRNEDYETNSYKVI